MLLVTASGRLRRQGLTEIFFESAEPSFDELDSEGLFRRFPAGVYEVGGLTLDSQELESEAALTHVLPAARQPLVNGVDDRGPDDESELGRVRPNGGPIEINGTMIRTRAILRPDVNTYRLPREILDAAMRLAQTRSVSKCSCGERASIRRRRSRASNCSSASRR